MAHISDIKLIRTDTTLDLSQKAEKGMSSYVALPIVLYQPPPYPPLSPGEVVLISHWLLLLCVDLMGLLLRPAHLTCPGTIGRPRGPWRSELHESRREIGRVWLAREMWNGACWLVRPGLTPGANRRRLSCWIFFFAPLIRPWYRVAWRPPGRSPPMSPTMSLLSSSSSSFFRRNCRSSARQFRQLVRTLLISRLVYL